MYHYEAELVFKSYMPASLEIGMYFVKVHPDRIVLWELDEVPLDKNSFLVEHGAPMELYIIDGDDNTLIAEPHEIGWMDDGDDVDELRDITLEDINTIINDYDGYCEIEIVESFYDEDEQLIPNMYEQKIVLRFVTEEEEE